MYKESTEAKKTRGRKFKAAAVKAGLSAKDLASALGCHVNTIHVWFKGPDHISNAKLDQIATLLKLPNDEFLDIFFPGYARIK